MLYQLVWKNMSFILEKNSVFIENIQFVNSSLENLIKNLLKDN